MAHGDLGAQGEPSWDLLRDQLDSLVEFRKGWKAQLNYLDRSPAGLAQLASEGLTPSAAQRRRWNTAKGKPTLANQKAIRRAYTTLRRRNVIRTLSRRLEARGGTRLEIHPEDQAPVERDNRRDLQVRDINVRNWYPIILAWSRGETNIENIAWVDILGRLGSNWRAYIYAASVGIQVS